MTHDHVFANVRFGQPAFGAAAPAPGIGAGFGGLKAPGFGAGVVRISLQ